MEQLFTGAGRPRKEEADERVRSFLRLVMGGCSLPAAAQRARLSPSRALKMLDDPVLLQVVLATRRRDLEREQAA